MDMRFYICRHCGKIMAVVRETGVPVMCCGEEMQHMKAAGGNEAGEKHVPHIDRKGNIIKVTVGSTPHPMDEEHFVEWIALCTEKGNQRKELSPGDMPQAEFCVCDSDKIVSVYAYCGKHGLWKNE